MALVTYYDIDGNEVTYDDGSDVSSGNYDWYDAGDTETVTPKAVDWSGASNITTEIENTASSGSPGYGWKYYSDGTAISPEGKYYYQGSEVYDPANQTGFWASVSKYLPAGTAESIKKSILNPNGTVNVAALGTAAAALKSAAGGNKVNPVGWQGSVPMDTRMIRSQIKYDDPNRRPGAQGRQYFSDTAYAAPANVDAAKTAVSQQAQGILSGYTPAAAPTPKYTAEKPAIAMPWSKRDTTTAATTSTPASGVASLAPVPTAQSVLGMASGGKAPRYLRGHTDGMADKIPSSIDGKQKAALSHGEFVIPADVVSHLGNGNSDAGAQKLYQMMAKVRQARTGNPNQGKRINPNKFMPGGTVGYAEGGDVKGFDGTTGSSVGTTGASTSGVTSATPLGTNTQSGLATWAGPYVADYLSKGSAVANAPYQAYTGPLTAGPSALQEQQFSGLSSLAQTGYDPSTFNAGKFDATAAQGYMNPYIKAALDPQIAELQRQGKIQNLANQAQFTKQGAFGSSGSVLAQTEGQRNVLDKINAALGQGYSTAYDKAQSAFTSDAQRALDAQKADEASRQFSADFGIKSLANLGTAGETQRAIEQAGIAADKAQFEEQRDYPAKMVQYQKDLMQGLPITASQTGVNQTDISNLSSQIQGLLSLYSTLSSLGQTK